MANVIQPILTNQSLLHRIRVALVQEIPNYPAGSQIPRPSGNFKPPALHAFMYPRTEPLPVPLSKFDRFTLEPQPLEGEFDGLAVIGIQAATNHGVRVALEKIVKGEDDTLKWVPSERGGQTIPAGATGSIQFAFGERALLIGQNFV